VIDVALLAALTISPASATLLECDRSAAPAAEFEARMTALSGATQMQMRFTLQASTPERPGFRRVAVPGFGTWTTADPGVTRYSYSRRVEALVGPASYRVMVRFRWLDAAGGQIAHTRKVSRACRQPDLRPNLTLGDVSLEPDGRYVVLVRNTGKRPAGPFELAVGDSAPVEVPSVAAGRERSVPVAGPACEPGATLTAVADTADVVDERSEDDNELSLACG
jgi:CARDB